MTNPRGDAGGAVSRGDAGAPVSRNYAAGAVSHGDAAGAVSRPGHGDPAATITELRALTGARGVAACCVVVYHIRLSVAGLAPGAVAILAKGYLAVDFFFLLSGFVLALAWRDRLRIGGAGARATFWQRRVARIWPLHLVMLMAAVILAIVLTVSGRHDPHDFPFGDLPMHILLVQNWGWTDHLAWNNPSWSISTEAAAYLLFPLIVMVDWRALPGPVLALVLAALFVFLHLVLASAGASTLGAEIPRFGLLRCLVEFTAGGIVEVIWQRWRTRPGLAAAAALIAGSLAIACRVVPETLAAPAGLAALLLLVAATSGPANPLSQRLLHGLGEISYAIYLSHFLLFVLFKLAFVRDAHAVPPVQVAAYLGLVLAVAVVLNRLVEHPAGRWVNGLVLRRPGRGSRDRGQPQTTV